MTHKGLKGRTILIVDDDSAVAIVVQQALEYQGAKVLHAPTGEEGLSVARSQSVDLVVLDVSLPKTDGFSVCRKLKADPATEALPIIFLSALNETRERVKGLRLGAIDYVVKPFDMDELIARIDIGLRIKGPACIPHQEESSTPAPEADVPTAESEEKSPFDLHTNGEFFELIEDRYYKLDPDSGLLTLALIRLDQEDRLVGESHVEVREKIYAAILEILADLCPKGTLFGRLNSFEVGALIPRKNKYGAELILDELRNLLPLRDFEADNEITRISLSCGVAEVPSAVISSAKEFEETANAALHRAQMTGGDRTILM